MSRHDLPWERYPLVVQHPLARACLTIQANPGLVPNTVAVYGRGLQDYFTFCHHSCVVPDAATRMHLTAYVQHLGTRPNPRGATRSTRSPTGLANAALHQQLTVVQLYHDYINRGRSAAPAV